MHEWSDLSRGRALALVTARDPRQFPVGMFQRDPVPPPQTGIGTFTWFADDAEAADFLATMVPVLLLDPESWPDFDALVAETRRIARTVPDDGNDRMSAIAALAEPWGGRADFVWWGEFPEIIDASSDFGRFITFHYSEYLGTEDDPQPINDIDAFVAFLRAYPY